MTKVPVKGAWYTCIFVSLVCFFLDLEQLSKIISLSNLISYSFVNAGVIALRFRPKQDEVIEVSRGRHEKYAWLFLVLAFITTMSSTWGWLL